MGEIFLKSIQAFHLLSRKTLVSWTLNMLSLVLLQLQKQENKQFLILILHHQRVPIQQLYVFLGKWGRIEEIFRNWECIHAFWKLCWEFNVNFLELEVCECQLNLILFHSNYLTALVDQQIQSCHRSWRFLVLKVKDDCYS